MSNKSEKDSTSNEDQSDAAENKRRVPTHKKRVISGIKNKNSDEDDKISIDTQTKRSNVILRIFF